MVKVIYGSWQRGLPYDLGMLAMGVILLGELILFWQQGEDCNFKLGAINLTLEPGKLTFLVLPFRHKATEKKR